MILKNYLTSRQKDIAQKCDGAAPIVAVDFDSFKENYDALPAVLPLGLKETTNGFRRFCADSNDPAKSDTAKVSALKIEVKKIYPPARSNTEKRKLSLQSGGLVLIQMKFDKPFGGGINHVETAGTLTEIL